MRVYVGMTLPGLRALVASGVLTGPVEACAVTPTLREWYAETDAEELEYAAYLAAGVDALTALAGDPQAPTRRVVVAVEVPEAAVTPDAARGRAAVTVTGDVPLSDLAAAHVDEDSPEAVDVVLAALGALDAAEAGDETAQLALGDAEDLDLLWYAPAELRSL